MLLDEDAIASLDDEGASSFDEDEVATGPLDDEEITKLDEEERAGRVSMALGGLVPGPLSVGTTSSQMSVLFVAVSGCAIAKDAEYTTTCKTNTEHVKNRFATDMQAI